MLNSQQLVKQEILVKNLPCYVNYYNNVRLLKKAKQAAKRDKKRKEKEQAQKEGRPWPPKRKRSDASVGMYVSHYLCFFFVESKHLL